MRGCGKEQGGEGRAGKKNYYALAQMAQILIGIAVFSGRLVVVVDSPGLIECRCCGAYVYLAPFDDDGERRYLDNRRD